MAPPPQEWWECDPPPLCSTRRWCGSHSSTAQLLARCSLRLASAVRAAPYTVMTIGVVLTVAASAGLVLDQPPQAALLDAWLPVGSWRQADQTTTESVWGAQRLEQVIVRPIDGISWSSTGGNATKTAVREALAFVSTLQYSLGADVRFSNGSSFVATYPDLCDQPALPFAPGCLTYSPLAWWQQHHQGVPPDPEKPPAANWKERFEADPDIWATLGQERVGGTPKGLHVQRHDVLAVQTAPSPTPTPGRGDHNGTAAALRVTEINAMMLWLFVNVDPALASDRGYVEGVDAW
jgi:hypothetical protein